MLGESTHLQVIPQQSTQMQQTCGYRHTTKTSELFLLFNMGVDFSSRNNFPNLGSFAKVSIPVKKYNSLVRWIPYMDLCSPDCLMTHISHTSFDVTKFVPCKKIWFHWCCLFRYKTLYNVRQQWVSKHCAKMITNGPPVRRKLGGQSYLTTFVLKMNVKN